MTVKERYSGVFRNLMYYTAIVTFIKKDGSVRNMLCTRCPETISMCKDGATAGMLNRYDNRCNINNGNVAVVDLVIGEPRQFNIERVVSLDFVAHIGTTKQFDEYMIKFKEFCDAYEKSHNMQIDMDLDEFEQ